MRVERNSSDSGVLVPCKVVNLVPQHTSDDVYSVTCSYCGKEIRVGQAALMEISYEARTEIIKACIGDATRSRFNYMVNEESADTYCTRKCTVENGSLLQ